MGFFSKKPRKNKVYSLEQAMKFVRNDYKYSAVETSGGYKVITDDKAKEAIDEFQQRRNEFKHSKQDFEFCVNWKSRQNCI